MKQIRITNGFPEMTDAYLVVRANFIRGSMLGNPSFLTPVPSMNDLGNATTAFVAAIENAGSGNRQEIAVKNQLRDSLINILHLLGNYVQFTAGGDEVVAKSSGYNISKSPEPRPAITIPEGLVLKNGLNKGELELSFKKVAGARSYAYEITQSPLSPATRWETTMNTVAKNLFSGLESGKEYLCRVAAIGIKQQVVYSEVVSRIAL